MLKLHNINKYYNPGLVNEIGIFRDFSLDIAKGDFVSIIGSNGSGKTSLLNLICGSITPDQGGIELEGRDVTRQSEHSRFRTIGRVFQNPSMGTCPSMTLYENLAMAENKNQKWDLRFCARREKRDKYREALAFFDLGLENKLDTRMCDFSGGQRQAVALMMATMTPISLLILDEHTAALDPKTADQIMKWTAEIVTSKSLTAIMVTHNLRYAVEYGNRLLMMHQGEILMDVRGEEKNRLTVDDLLDQFYSISIETGN